MSESLIPRPPLNDRIKLDTGQELELTRDNTTLVFHQGEKYSDMDHIFIRKLGEHGLRVFNFYHVAEYLIGKGYDILIRQYPDDATVAVWTQIQMANMERELNGEGNEFDE